MKFVKIIFIMGLVIFSLVSCATTSNFPVEREDQIPLSPSFLIVSPGKMSSDKLYDFFLEQNPSADLIRVRRLAHLYIAESKVEGINHDVAFVQMCLETGFLRFGGLVTKEMNNFCGLGSLGPGEPGLAFPDEQTGVRAHIQHLKGYGTSEPLVGDLVDPRYKYVNPKGKAPRIHGLAGTWASDREYGIKLEKLLIRLYS
ncbi:MAG TPA: glucosaminidase domain-containing protein [Treponemataceae bacterium]|nr:glucosaminidase domain-containing protein [Treponemataceae bacterium]